MSAYLGEIRLYAGVNFAPDGWMFCHGQLLEISEYETLFNLIGTTYGGDGRSTFALPDLRGRVPIHQGNGFDLGQPGGTDEIILTEQQIPVHYHGWLGTDTSATALTPLDNMPAQASKNFYVAPITVSPMASEAMGSSGGGQPHNNVQPYLCVNFIIALDGGFPPPP